jgi:rod shape-determining protein MreB and related proteins
VTKNRYGMRSVFSLFSSDLAIDLGTANTLVAARSKGIVVNEPSIVAINKNSGEVIAVGREAKEMLGRVPGNVVAIKPMKDGVIADFKVTEKMLTYFIRKAYHRRVLVHPRIVIGVPSEITPVERRAVQDSAYRAGASEVYLVEQALAAAIGARLPIEEPSGNMVVDIGGGTTDIALISMSGIVYSRSVRVAGNKMDEAVMQYLKRKHNLLVGERTAEQIKMEIGSAYPLDKPLTIEVKGRNLIEGMPRTVTIDDSEIREALSECLTTILNAIRMALECTPPELSADISDRGIVLTGGGALLKNLDKRIREETGLPVSIADDPLASVVLGTGKMLSDFRLLDIARHCLPFDPKRRWTVADIAKRLKPRVEAQRTEQPVQRDGWPTRSRNLVLAVILVLALIGFIGLKLLNHFRGGDGQLSQANEESSEKAPPETQQSKSAVPSNKKPMTLGHEQSSSSTSQMPVSPRTEAPTVPGASAASSGVIRKVLPAVPQNARDTIRGTVRVGIKVSVDPSGNVTDATIDSPGPSKYFANLALQAAPQWKFAPARDGSSDWILRFKFSVDGTKASAKRN